VAGEEIARLVGGLIVTGVMLVVFIMALQETFDWWDRRHDDDGEG